MTTFFKQIRKSSLLAAAPVFACLLVILHLLDPILTLLRVPADPALTHDLSFVLLTLAWLVGAYIVNRLVEFFFWDFAVARAIGSAVPGALKALGAIVIFLVALTCIVGVVFDRSVTGFLAALGAGSFALGLALRNLFSDIFTGLAVNLDRTFRIGDWIEISERAGVTVGQIEEIGWRSTHLRTEEQKTIVIPNSYLGIHKITNVSRPTLATRYQVTITLDFSVPVNRGKRVLLASLQAVHDLPGFFPDKKPEVLAGEATDDGLNYILRYWIISWTGITPNRARDVVMTSAMEHLRTAGISPSYEKADIFHRAMPLRSAEGHTREDQLALLARLDLFSMLEEEEIGKIADEIVRRAYHGGQVLFQQGEAGDSLFVLIEGLLDVLVNTGDNNGTGQPVGRVLPGEFVGEMSLLTGEPRSATIRAITQSVAYEIKGGALRSLLESRPQIAGMLSQIVAERKLRNAETARHSSEGNRAEETTGFARQLLTRMMNFLNVHRG